MRKVRQSQQPVVKASVCLMLACCVVRRVLLESHPAMAQVLAILSPNMLSSVGPPAAPPPPQPVTMALPGRLGGFPFAPPPTARRS